jgi:hypothetical protein
VQRRQIVDVNVLKNCVTVSSSYFIAMESHPKALPDAAKPAIVLYCPVCAAAVSDPLTCGDCSAVICRRCGTPLESSDELGMG